jgi:hypothetical protein
MIDPELRRRIRNVENLLAKSEKVVSDEQKKRAARYEASITSMRPFAQHHATAVAAIVLFGNPQIDEPLKSAWIRALQCLGIRDEYEREYSFTYKLYHGDEANGIKAYYRDREYINACKQLYPIIIKDANESEKFAEIFAPAPIWLLNFTNVAVDGVLLKFNLPPMCSVLSSKGVWKFWPHIPFGTATDDDRGADVAS